MKTWIIEHRVQLLVMLCVLVAMPFLPAEAQALGMVGFAGMIAPDVKPKTRAELIRLAYPENANQPEAIPHVLYDTLLYTSAATTTLTYYATQQADPTMSNLDQAGALSEPQWFEIWNLGCDVLQDGTISSVNLEDGALDNIAKLFLVGRPTFTLVISAKNYGPYPLSFLHTSGGPQGIGYGAAAATTGVQFGMNGFADGGWNWRGQVVIPPKVNFKVIVNWAAAQTLIGGNPHIRFWMAGALHRRVL